MSGPTVSIRDIRLHARAVRDDSGGVVDPTWSVRLASGRAIDGQAQAELDKGCHGFIKKLFTLQPLSGKIGTMLEVPDANHPAPPP